MRQFVRRLHYLLHRRRLERELAEEMEVHRDMASETGGTPFGNTLRLREEAREAWGWTWIDRFFQDIRDALRMMRKSPGFTLAAVSMLAAGIGATVAVFGFFDLMVLRPLDVRDPETLLRFHRKSPREYAYGVPYPEMAFLREHSRTLAAVIALTSSRLTLDEDPKPVEGQFVSVNYFAELGGTAAIGRLLDPRLDRDAGSDAAVILSYPLWQSRFGGDPLVLGRTVKLNGKPARIAGVAARSFGGLSLDQPGLWIPITRQPDFVSGSHLLTDFSAENSAVLMFGRMRPGLAPKAVETELKMLAVELRKEHSEAIWEDESLLSQPAGYAKSLRLGYRRGTGVEDSDPLLPLFALLGTMVLLILVVACGNLGNLLLARGVARQREIAIRISVGAGPARLVRQLLTESLVLSLVGAGAGLLVGHFVMRTLLSVTGAPEWLDPAPDWRVILFATGAGVASALLFGMAPALQLARQRRASATLRQVLVGAQVASSCVLLIVAGLLGRALSRAAMADPGFDYRHVIAIEPGLGRHGYSAEKSRAYLETLRTRLLGVPGVDAVSVSLTAPLGRVSITAGVDIEGRSISVQVNRADAEFFRVLKLPIVRGRNLAAGESRTAVVSESLARSAWPNQDALGKALPLGPGYTVVGITAAARVNRLEDSDSLEAYLPLEPEDSTAAFVLVRTSGTAESAFGAVAAEARSAAPDTFPEVELVKTGFERKVRSAEYTAVTVSALAFIAHLLACLGIAGLVSFAVAQRTKEIGIRMALGAAPANIVRTIAGQFSRPVLGGMAVGLGIAVAASGVLRSVLYGVSNLDIGTYLATMALLAGTLAAAAFWPARKAARIDPLRALRHD